MPLLPEEDLREIIDDEFASDVITVVSDDSTFRAIVVSPQTESAAKGKSGSHVFLNTKEICLTVMTEDITARNKGDELTLRGASVFIDNIFHTGSGISSVRLNPRPTKAEGKDWD